MTESALLTFSLLTSKEKVNKAQTSKQHVHETQFEVPWWHMGALWQVACQAYGGMKMGGVTLQLGPQCMCWGALNHYTLKPDISQWYFPARGDL